MSIDIRLAQLEQAQLVHRAEDPDPAYLFRHTLTQETAYESLLLKRRREMHRLVAQSYERLYPQRLDELAAVLAQHYAQVGDDVKTVEYAERAGDVAARVYAQVEARLHYGQALSAMARLPVSVERTRKRIDLELKYFEVAWTTGATQNMLELVDEMESLAATLTGVAGEAPTEDRLRLARIHYSRGSVLLARGQMPEALSYFYKVAEEARALPAGPYIAIPLELIGGVLMFQGHFRRALPYLEQARATSRDYPNTWYKVGATIYWVTAHGALGEFRGMREELEREIEIAQAAGYLSGVASASAGLTILLFMQRDIQGTRDMANAALRWSERANDPLYVFIAHGIKGWAESRLGDVEQARDDMRRTQELLTHWGGQAFAGDWMAAVLAETAFQLGARDEAIALAQSAVKYAQSVGGLYAEAAARRTWAQAVSVQNLNDAQVEENLHASLNLLETCEALPEIARTHFVWGEILRERGEAKAARDHFEKAKEQFEGTGLARELDETRAVLTTISQ